MLHHPSQKNDAEDRPTCLFVREMRVELFGSVQLSSALWSSLRNLRHHPLMSGRLGYVKDGDGVGVSRKNWWVGMWTNARVVPSFQCGGSWITHALQSGHVLVSEAFCASLSSCYHATWTFPLSDVSQMRLLWLVMLHG